MRHRFWDESSDHVLNEKQFLQQTLIEQGIFNNATFDDVKYFFYTLPSIVIVKAVSYTHLTLPTSDLV